MRSTDRDDDADSLLAHIARLVVEEGHDYASARRKAARQWGGRGVALPSNEAVEDAVREHLAIFYADSQAEDLRVLRELALQWMMKLQAWQPHVAGAVWRGTATRHSAIVLDLYAPDSKEVEIDFLNRGWPFEPAGGPDDPVVLSLEVPCRAWGETVSLHCRVNPTDELRGALQPDARGRSWRGATAALQALLQAEATP